MGDWCPPQWLGGKGGGGAVFLERGVGVWIGEKGLYVLVPRLSLLVVVGGERGLLAGLEQLLCFRMLLSALTCSRARQSVQYARLYLSRSCVAIPGPVRSILAWCWRCVRMAAFSACGRLWYSCWRVSWYDGHVVHMHATPVCPPRVGKWLMFCVESVRLSRSISGGVSDSVGSFVVFAGCGVGGRSLVDSGGMPP